MTPQISGKALLIPGWRAEVVIDDLAMGDIIIGEFVETREEAERAASQACYDAARGQVSLIRG